MSQQAQQEEKTKLQQEHDKLIKEIVQLAQEEEEENERKRKILRKKGFVITLSYHCNRCNYVWLPRDFDTKTSDPLNSGINIIHEIPPKCCARCKSKQWNIEPKRKTKENPDPTNLERWSNTRIISEYRGLLFRNAKADKRIKHLQEFAKKKGIRLD
jgi:hypothetical protein